MFLVILVPYGLAGTLTGQVGRVDSQLLEEWKNFYPINTSILEPGLPALVEVLVGGVRMRYPSCYVLVTDMDESPMTTMSNFSTTCSNGTSPGPIEITMPLSPPNSPASYEHPLSMQRDLGPSTKLPERVWAECIVGGGCRTKVNPAGNGESPLTTSHTELGSWSFVDPAVKSSCICNK